MIQLTNNKKLNISIILYLISFILIISLLILNNKIPCAFKELFNTPCPFCGLTRSLKSLLKFDIGKSLYYNILTIPIVIFAIYFIVLFIKDIIRKDNKSILSLYNFFKKYWILILILIIISEIVNIIHGI